MRVVAGVAAPRLPENRTIAPRVQEKSSSMGIPGGTARQRIIPDVPRPEGLCTALACLDVILRSQGVDTSYQELMGVSSQAFRIQFNWSAGIAHAFRGFNTFEMALRAVGYEATTYRLAAWDSATHHYRQVTDEELATARDAVKASIEAGVPLLFSSEQSGVLAGFEPISEENPTGWLRLHGPMDPPRGTEDPYVRPIHIMPWEVCLFRQSDAGPLSEQQAILLSLQAAVRNARNEGNAQYRAGFAAFEAWARDLRDMTSVSGVSEEDLERFRRGESVPFEVQLANAWCYDSLIDARRNATAYLRSAADLFAPAVLVRLRAAAAAAEDIAEILAASEQGSTAVAPYPWTKDIRWNQALRDEQAARLRQALPAEQQMIHEIHQALSAAEAL